MSRNAAIILAPSFLLVISASAHKHYDELTEEQKNAPVDTILWLHIFLQPQYGVFSSQREWSWDSPRAGGMSHYRCVRLPSYTPPLAHVGYQSAGFALIAAGHAIGHSHGVRAFLAGAHGKLANILFVPIALQLALGIYLKLHIHEETIRSWAVMAHGVVGKAYPIFGWVQMLFDAIAFRGYCRGRNLGQCLAHYIMVRLRACPMIPRQYLQKAIDVQNRPFMPLQASTPSQTSPAPSQTSYMITSLLW